MVRLIIVGLLAAILSACAHTELKPGEGYVDVEGGKVWYRVVGSGGATPLLLLHGGPGAPSNYLRPLEQIAVDRPVIFYDQLGAGRSPAPADNSLWNMGRFVNACTAFNMTLFAQKMDQNISSVGRLIYLCGDLSQGTF